MIRFKTTHPHIGIFSVVVDQESTVKFSEVVFAYQERMKSDREMTHLQCVGFRTCPPTFASNSNILDFTAPTYRFPQLNKLYLHRIKFSLSALHPRPSVIFMSVKTSLRNTFRCGLLCQFLGPGVVNLFRLESFRTFLLCWVFAASDFHHVWCCLVLTEPEPVLMF